MKCDACFCEDTYIKDYEHNYFIRDKEIKFVAPRRFCSKCNSLVYDSELDNNAGSIAIDLYNQQYGIPKEKIIELRNNFELSQDLFSKIIGCAKKTLISYEKGSALPNDNYIILINSLIAKPETLATLVEANKGQFTEKEYNKIQKGLTTFLGNNSKQLFNVGEFEPTEFNGYTRINKDKIINMILIFAKNCILKTKLLKEMFYADFLYYKNTGASITGLEYAKITYGPVPDGFSDIINECLVEGLIDYNVEYMNDYENHNIQGRVDVDYKVFDKDELEIINKVNEFFKDFKSKDVVNFSHEEKAFTETEFSKSISYDYAFDIDRIA